MALDPSEAAEHVCPQGSPPWMTTMADLMSNLLVFFVLMLSFANTDKQIFLETMESIQSALGIIDPTRFSATRPLAPNNSPENLAANRRIEFVYKRGPVEAAKTSAKTSAEPTAADRPAPRVD